MLLTSPGPFRSPPSGSRRLGSIFASGVVLGLSYPPFPLAPLAWIALVPLLLLWEGHTSARAAFVDAYGAFLITFAVAFHWPLFHTYAETALLSAPGLLLIPMWMAVPFGLSHLLRKYGGAAVGLAGLIALYVVMEWGLRRGPFAFPWSLLGHSQAELYPLNGLSRFGGVPLLTAYVLALNALGFVLVARLPRLVLPFATLVLVGAAAVLVPVSDRQADSELRIGLVQPAVSAEEWADFDDPRRLGILLALSDTLVASAASAEASRTVPDARRALDLVVWPETALPPGDARSRGAVQRWVDARRVPLLTGAIEASADGRPYNAALLVRPDGNESVYRKRRLVPFAEHVPFQDRWPWVRRLAVPSGGVPGYARGERSEPVEIRTARLGVLICFETLFDDAARLYARRGADVIVAITQDGWWGDSFGYEQHLAFTRLRAIETGRPLVQVSVSGLSAVVGPDGAILDRIGWMERRSATAIVPVAPRRTFYRRAGDWVSPLALTVILVLTAAAYRRS